MLLYQQDFRGGSLQSFFFSSRRRHTRCGRDWSSDVCSSDLTSAALGTGLALRGHKTVIVDFDIGLRNLDLVMGCERRVVYDFVNVINGDATLHQALIKDKRLDNLYVLAASQTRDKEALTQEGVGRVLDELSSNFEYVICDSPAGIERGA